MDLAVPRITLTCPHETGRLGVTMSSEHSGGALICAIEKGSRAERAGLRLGDAIIQVNGAEAETAVCASGATHSRAHRHKIEPPSGY
mmetsp:Transcript_1837/g.4857  ORF Transcript_1837/g.4857 Transcript_1837/m.4857 type:complete len:87 (-) Transcript_1837:428-688(-)